MRTVRGIVLGDSIERAEAVYEKAFLQSIPLQPGMTLLSYDHVFNRSCGQIQNFAFSHNRLVYIELLNAC